MSGTWRRAGALTSRVATRCAVSMLLVAACVAAVDSRGETDSRLRIAEFSPDRVLRLTGFVGYHIHLEFAPDERFVSLASGDTSGLEVAAEGNHLLLKPKTAIAGTNLTVLTSRRVYFIDFRSLARAPRASEAVYSVTFRYPPAETNVDSQPVTGIPEAALVSLPPARNRDYWYCGSSALRPLTVDDDGVQIRIRFRAETELPAIYIAEPDGSEALVNTHVEDGMLVVHRMAARLVLRRGRQVGCVVNRGREESHRRTGTGTLSGAVERSTREANP